MKLKQQRHKTNLKLKCIDRGHYISKCPIYIGNNTFIAFITQHPVEQPADGTNNVTHL